MDGNGIEEQGAGRLGSGSAGPAGVGSLVLRARLSGRGVQSSGVAQKVVGGLLEVVIVGGAVGLVLEEEEEVLVVVVVVVVLL